MEPGLGKEEGFPETSRFSFPLLGTKGQLFPHSHPTLLLLSDRPGGTPRFPGQEQPWQQEVVPGLGAERSPGLCCQEEATHP